MKNIEFNSFVLIFSRLEYVINVKLLENMINNVTFQLSINPYNNIIKIKRKNEIIAIKKYPIIEYKNIKFIFIYSSSSFILMNTVPGSVIIKNGIANNKQNKSILNLAVVFGFL